MKTIASVNSFFNKVRKSGISKNIYYYAITIFFSQGSTFFANLAVANIFSVAMFGKYTFILNMVNMLSVVTGIGLTNTANRFVSEYRKKEDNSLNDLMAFLLKLLAIVNVPVILILLFSHKILGENVFEIQEDITFFIFISLSIVISSLYNFFIGFSFGLQKFKELCYASIGFGLSYFGFIYIAALYFDLYGIFLALLLAKAIYLILIVRLGLKGLKFSLNDSGLEKNDKRKLLNFIIPNFFIALIAGPAAWFSQKFLTEHPNGFEEIASFNICLSIITLGSILPSLANTVVSSYLYSNLNNNTVFSRLLNNSSLLLIAISVLEVIGLLLVGKFILSLFGMEYIQSYTLLAVLAVTLILDITASSLGNIIVAQRRMWDNLFKIALPRDATLLVLAYFLAIPYGAMGLAVAYVISRVIWALSTYIAYLSLRKNINQV